MAGILIQSQGNRKKVWKALRLVAQSFLGRHRTLNSKQFVEELLGACGIMRCNMLIKIHFLHSL
jgi:hypothetical protein